MSRYAGMTGWFIWQSRFSIETTPKSPRKPQKNMFSLKNCGIPYNLGAVSVIRDEAKTYAWGPENF